jgi:prephenate dehydrogenase
MAELDRVAIVGVGLIGGSIGLALRERRLASEVVGVGRNQTSLSKARQLGAVDRFSTDIQEGVADANFIIVCTPVDTIAEFVHRISTMCRSDALITDAGSTKEAIVSAIERQQAGQPRGPYFVGSHPLAGDHRTGVEFARADLLGGRKVIVTPTAKSDRNALAKVGDFWTSLGAVVMEMSPAEHDAALAATSHLPHLVAFALTAATPQDLLPLAASGWRDTTRIAGGDPNMWRPIFTANRAHVLAALERFEGLVGEMRSALATGDERRLMQILEQAREIKSKRDALGD